MRSPSRTVRASRSHHVRTRRPDRMPFIRAARGRRPYGDGLCVDGSRLLRADIARIRKGIGGEGQRCLRYGRDQIDRIGEPSAGGEGAAPGGCLLVERARSHARAEVPRRAGIVPIAEREGYSCGPCRSRGFLDRFLGAHARHCVQHEDGDSRTMRRNPSSTWPIRSGRARSRWPTHGLDRRRFTSQHCTPSLGTRRWTTSSAV